MRCPMDRKTCSLSQKLFRTYAGWFLLCLFIILCLAIWYVATVISQNIADTREQLSQNIDENIENYFPIPTEYMPNEESFMLNVKGDSMINVGIFNGDRVLVQKQHTAENGDIVVALVDDSATVKTYYKEDGYYRLQPENDSMEPIIVTEVEILGKVFGVFRLYS